MSDFAASWRLSRGRFLDAIKDLNTAQLNWRLHPDSLTLGEAALHVAGVEVSFMSQLLDLELDDFGKRLKAAAMSFFTFYAENPRDLDLGFYLFRGGMKPSGLGRKRDEAMEKGLKLLDRVGLKAHASKFPGQLSGGQQQRVAIARALAMDPICMLFDEPTSALDPEMINEVLDVMVELAREGMTMMCVTHEMGFARKVAHRVIFMDRGAIVEDAAKDDFFGKPRSERAQTFLAKILQH